MKKNRISRRFCLLSALARGFLTRRLFRTHKVQSLVSSIRDAMATALQLHRESSSSSSSMPVSQAVVTPQDVELHRRLLMQINKDCQVRFVRSNSKVACGLCLFSLKEN